MKKKLILIITLYILIRIFLNYKDIQTNIIEISLMFFKNIFPSLFIFFIISNILINYDIVKYINSIFGILFKKIFNLNKYTFYILIMSMLSGIPSSAKYTNELLDKKLINLNEAQKTILFSHFANPLFILFITPTRPFLILFSHYIPNFIMALFLRGKKINETSNKMQTDSKSFTDVLIESINNAFNTLFIVLGLIIIFYILSNLTNSFLLKYILEMSSSLNYILSLNIYLKLKLMLMGGILSFGGLCTHMQVFSILKNKKIKYYPYLLARIIHFCLTTIIIYIMY